MLEFLSNSALVNRAIPVQPVIPIIIITIQILLSTTAVIVIINNNLGIEFFQIRAISNYVEERSKEKWNISLAIKNLNLELNRILDAYEN